MNRNALLIVILTAGLASPASGADPCPFPCFHWLRHTPQPFWSMPDARPPERIADYVAGGNIVLSLRAYLELVLRNNTDIALAKLPVHVLQNAVTRSYGAFDPSLQSSFSPSHSAEQTTTSLQGAPSLISVAEPFTLNYQRLLESGTSVNIGFNAGRYWSNDSYDTYNPAFTSSLNVQFNQPLLRNRGGLSTRLTILVAKSNLRAGVWRFRDQVTALLANAENAYWDAVQARENLAIEKKLLELRKAALELTRKQVAAGALLALDLYQPSANCASAELAAIQAKQALLKAENAIRQQIGADLDPQFRSLPIVLTEPYDEGGAVPDRERAVRQAMAARPDRAGVEETLRGDDLGIRAATDALRPSLSLTGTYTSQGLGGVLTEFGGSQGSPVVTETASGFGDALAQMFRFHYPVYSAGIALTLPLRNRAGEADMSNAYVAKRQDELQLRKLDQNIRLQVLNAIDGLETLQAAMRQAAAARDFATRRFAAEQKKYELGVTQMFFVLDAQTQLNVAESESLSESIAWQRSLLNLHVVIGDLLAERGVALADWPGDAHHPDPGAIWPESARGAAPVGTGR